MNTFLAREPGTDMFRSLHDEVDRVFNRYQDFTPANTGRALLAGNDMMKLQPRNDISETDIETHVEAELPGVELAEVEVSIVTRCWSFKARNQNSGTHR